MADTVQNAGKNQSSQMAGQVVAGDGSSNLRRYAGKATAGADDGASKGGAHGAAIGAAKDVGIEAARDVAKGVNKVTGGSPVATPADQKAGAGAGGTGPATSTIGTADSRGHESTAGDDSMLGAAGKGAVVGGAAAMSPSAMAMVMLMALFHWLKSFFFATLAQVLGALKMVLAFLVKAGKFALAPVMGIGGTIAKTAAVVAGFGTVVTIAPVAALFSGLAFSVSIFVLLGALIAGVVNSTAITDGGTYESPNIKDPMTHTTYGAKYFDARLATMRTMRANNPTAAYTRRRANSGWKFVDMSDALLATSKATPLPFTPIDDDFTAAPVGVPITPYLKKNWKATVSSPTMSRASIVQEGGNRFVRLRYPKGKTGAGNSGSSWRAHLAPADEMTARYRVRFDPDFDWTEGGKLPGLTGGTSPTGGKPSPKGFSARYMWKPNGGLIVYLYHSEQPGRYGQAFNLGQRLKRGEWYTLEQRIKLNTPGQADGVLEVWVNGKPALTKSDIRWRLGHDDWSIDSFYFSSFHGGSGERYQPDRDNHIDFNDVSVTARPSGR